VTSLGVISGITLLSLGWVAAGRFRRGSAG
jgi:hypothetical protein